MPEPKDTVVYGATIKLFGSQPDPPFEDRERLTRLWGREWGCDNDVGRLRCVLMHRPGEEFNVIDPSKAIPEIGAYGDLEEGWYWQSRTISTLADMQAQHDALADLLRSEGVEVVYLKGVEDGRFKSVYTRDSCIAIKGGMIVPRLAPRMRHGEERAVTRTLGELGAPILRTLNGRAMLEGGSFAWINERTAVVGRGVRNNDEGVAQLFDTLARQGVELIVVDLRGYDIHIDGHFLMIHPELALVWAQGLPFIFLEKLKSLGVRAIEMTENDNRWVVNGLAVRPGRVVMPEGLSDETRAVLEREGVDILTLAYDAIHRNGGGIHCSTSPLIRDRLS